MDLKIVVKPREPFQTELELRHDNCSHSRYPRSPNMTKTYQNKSHHRVFQLWQPLQEAQPLGCMVSLDFSLKLTFWVNFEPKLIIFKVWPKRYLTFADKNHISCQLWVLAENFGAEKSVESMLTWNLNRRRREAILPASGKHSKTRRVDRKWVVNDALISDNPDEFSVLQGVKKLDKYIVWYYILITSDEIRSLSLTKQVLIKCNKPLNHSANDSYPWKKQDSLYAMILFIKIARSPFCLVLWRNMLFIYLLSLAFWYFGDLVKGFLCVVHPGFSYVWIHTSPQKMQQNTLVDYVQCGKQKWLESPKSANGWNTSSFQNFQLFL